MPLSIYERTRIKAGIPVEYPMHKCRMKLHNRLLASALTDVIGGDLPSFVFYKEHRVILAASSAARKLIDLRRDAGILAVLIEGRYD